MGVYGDFKHRVLGATSLGQCVVFISLSRLLVALWAIPISSFKALLIVLTF